jgi:hypothetical protein
MEVKEMARKYKELKDRTDDEQLSLYNLTEMMIKNQMTIISLLQQIAEAVAGDDGEMVVEAIGEMVDTSPEESGDEAEEDSAKVVISHIGFDIN